MSLWAAAILFIACVGGAAGFIILYRKSKKAYFIAITAAVTLLALVLLAYVILTLMLLAGVS